MCVICLCGICACIHVCVIVYACVCMVNICVFVCVAVYVRVCSICVCVCVYVQVEARAQFLLSSVTFHLIFRDKTSH